MATTSSASSTHKEEKASNDDDNNKSSAASSTFQHNFTQTSQYSKDVIQQFEVTFGKHYMSAGGGETTQETARLLEPVLSLGRSSSTPSSKDPQLRILDVGCGIGGACFFFAHEYGAHVLGVDVNAVGIAMAQEELAKQQQQNPSSSSNNAGTCRFETLNVVTADFDDESFDIIYSRDVLLHLTTEQKITVFCKFQRWLKPGGMVCLTDYCLGPKSAVAGVSVEFQAYLDTRGYHLLTPIQYKQLFVEHAEFQDDFVESRDCQLWYCQTSQREMDRLLVKGSAAREAFLQEKSQADLDKLVQVYQDKITMTLRGDRSYVMLTAQKQPRHFTQRQQVVQAYRTLSEKSYIMSCDGNVSCRTTSGDDETFLVTPSGVTIPDLTPSKVVLCHLSTGKAVAGEHYKPSSESALHDCIYRARPDDVGAIVHMHSIYVCALACCRLPLPPAHYAVCELLQTFDFASPTGGSTTVPNIDAQDATVQCAPYHTYGTKALAAATLQGLGRNHAVLMANHGAVVVGADLETALYNAERLERECEIYWRCLQMQSVGPPKPLTLTEIRDLQSADETYGQEHPDNPEDAAAAAAAEEEEDSPDMVETTSDEGSSNE